jgi:cupin fold WbuC family metalloprotein
MLIQINQELLDKTTNEALISPRRRAWFLFHELTEHFHRMLNAIEPNSYVMPHCHPDKVETFLALRGKAAIPTFDEKGNVIDCPIIEAGTLTVGVEIETNTWHSVLSLEPGTILYEVLEGPYIKADHKTFAHDWSPPEDEHDAGVAWLKEKLISYINY